MLRSPSDDSAMTRRPSGDRIGVFGGTFDPVHEGHVRFAELSMRRLRLDTVLFVVAGFPWMKAASRPVISPGHVRLEMVRLAIEGRPGMVADDREVKRGGASYSADTLEELTAERPGAKLFLLVGADTFETLPQWSRLPRVLELASMVVLPRAKLAHNLDVLDSIAPEASARLSVLDEETVEYSSSWVRSQIAAGKDCGEALAEPVAAYIERNGLYRSNPDGGGAKPDF